MSVSLIDFSTNKKARDVELAISDHVLLMKLPSGIAGVLKPMKESAKMTVTDLDESISVQILETLFVSEDDFFEDKPVIYIQGSHLLPPPSNAPKQRRVKVLLAVGESNLLRELQGVVANDDLETRPLFSGDVNFVLVEENGQEALLDIVIERKEANDFVSSKLDGRLDSQTEVMLRNFSNNNLIFHCIEGELQETRPIKTFNHKAILGSLIYPMFRHGSSVAMVPDTTGTAMFVANIKNLLEHADEKKFKEKLVPSSRAMNGAVKKKTINEENQVYAQLVSIRGVGEVCAAAIVKVYPTFADIFKAYFSNGQSALTNVPTPNGKVGEGVSKRIHEVYRPDCFSDKIPDATLKRVAQPDKSHPVSSQRKKVKIIDDIDE